MHKRRNMKRVLSIVLALAMMLGIISMVGAAYESHDDYPSYEPEIELEYAPEPDYIEPDYSEDNNEYYDTYYDFVEPIEFAPLSAALFSGGSGTVSDPFRIATSEDLLQMSLLTSGNDQPPAGITTAFLNTADYVLVSNVDMSNIFNFMPIGQLHSNGFVGSFNGAGHTISNLYINFDLRIMPFGSVFSPNELNGLGLFGVVHNANISNVNLNNPTVVALGHERDNVALLVGTAVNSNISNINITGGTVNAPESGNIGGIAGTARNTSIQNVNVEASITGAGNTGGAVGNMTNAPIDNVTVTANIVGANNTGGIVGIASGGSVSATTFTGSVSGGDNVGGTVGSATASTISDSGTTNNTTVTGRDNVGGVFGFATEANQAFDNFSRANVTGINQVGGIGGLFYTTATGKSLTHSYSAGEIRGNDNVGGILGMVSFSGSTRAFTLSDTYSHATIYANSNVGGILGNAYWRTSPASSLTATTNITRNYASVSITATGNNAGGILGAAGSRGNVGRSRPIISNNLVIADIVAPSVADNASIVANQVGNNNLITYTNNFFSFASTIRGGAVGNFDQAERVHQQSLSMPGWWTSFLAIGAAFDTSPLWNGELPTLLMRGSTVEVRKQEGLAFSGNSPPEISGTFYHVLGTQENLFVGFTAFGGATVRDIPGLQSPRDYIVVGESIMFTHTFLNTLDEGPFAFRVNFISGHVIMAEIDIREAPPRAPGLRADVVRFSWMSGNVAIGINNADILSIGIDIYESSLYPAIAPFAGLLQSADTDPNYRIIELTGLQAVNVFGGLPLPGQTAPLQITFENGTYQVVTLYFQGFF